MHLFATANFERTCWPSHANAISKKTPLASLNSDGRKGLKQQQKSCAAAVNSESHADIVLHCNPSFLKFHCFTLCFQCFILPVPYFSFDVSLSSSYRKNKGRKNGSLSHWMDGHIMTGFVDPRQGMGKIVYSCRRCRFIRLIGVSSDRIKYTCPPTGWKRGAWV